MERHLDELPPSPFVMAALSFVPGLSFLAAFSRMSPAVPLRTLLRATRFKLRPPRPLPHEPLIQRAQNDILAEGRAALHQRASILHEPGRGEHPTIVLGGFVPHATEQVFLLRHLLLKQGNVYYVNYPTQGFSSELVYAQLDDLVEELRVHRGQSPVIFAVSFGVGLVLEWLRRARRSGRHIELKGLILVSPVACAEDLLDPTQAKATTLLGRAIRPFLGPDPQIDAGVIERARGIFRKMFESGAQNRTALLGLMTKGELQYLQNAVIESLQRIDSTGACERIQALKGMEALSQYLASPILPLSTAPTLILYAEKESSVIVDTSPSRLTLESTHRVFFPQGEYRTITNPRGTAVQHASLIFHCSNFLPPIASFYRALKVNRAPQAA